MEWGIKEVVFRVILGVERSFIVIVAYYIMIILSPQTLAVAEAHMPLSAEALAAAVASISFFSGFFKRTIFGKIANAARDLLVITVLALMDKVVSLTIQGINITVDASLLIMMLIAASIISFASTIMSAIGQLAESV